MTPADVLSSPTPRLWMLFGMSLENENYMLKNVYGDMETIEHEEFGEEWDKVTAPPEWFAKREKEKELLKKKTKKKHPWSRNDG